MYDAFTFLENSNQMFCNHSDWLCVARNNPGETIVDSDVRIRKIHEIRLRCRKFDTKICRRASDGGHRE